MPCGSRRCRSTPKAGRRRFGFRCRNCGSAAGPGHLGNQCRTVHPAEQRERVARDGAEIEDGVASRMIHLVGLDGLQPRRRIELLPYAAARTEFVAAEPPGSPFNDGSRAFFAAGLDVKWGITSNLTLNATVNPDFGQVEVDPAVVNLSAFETFYPEKRPFFLEGSQIFGSFGSGGANSFWGFNSEDPLHFLLATNRARASARRQRRLRRYPRSHDDPGRHQAHREDEGRVEHRAARGGHRARDRAHPIGVARRAGCRGAAE